MTMGKVTQLYDGLINALANVGTDRDKAAQSRYQLSVLGDDELLAAYRCAWLPKKIVDLPALDAVREWRTWTDDSVATVEGSLGLRRKVLSALTHARLFGYAGIYIGTGASEPSRPLNGNEGIKQLVVLGKKDFGASEYSDDPMDAGFGEPSMYMIGSRRVHPSRVALFIGAAVPDQRESGVLGDSVLLAPYEALRNADAVAANAASLVFEAKIDVLKIPGLMQKVGNKAYEDKLMQRLRVAMLGKSLNNALVVDADEDYEQKQVSFGSLNDLMITAYQVAAGAARIPMTRLLGRSASGLNSSGDNEVRDYYDTVRAQQTLSIGPALAMIDKLMAGDREVDYEWNSLWQLDAKTQADANQANATAINDLAGTNIFPLDALAELGASVMGFPALAEEPPGPGDGE